MTAHYPSSQAPPRTGSGPEQGEVLYVPGPVSRETPQDQGAWQEIRRQMRQGSAEATPRSTMDEVTLAKQNLLDVGGRGAGRGRGGAASLLAAKPLHVALGVAALIAVITYIPITRTTFKVGAVFALRALIKRLVSRFI